ncbi:sigma 54-interacting transcriptional regulator [Silvibacterium acidisoli]|uniref:sigma 54-interacting transcriptional regulator n=1 Tax=Acidobacteriaceae bacterium ZG23-2 TaxID=2883246 RepID=UPI00406C55DE
MPESKQYRVLIALQNEKAISTLRGYFRAHGGVAELQASVEDVAEKARALHPDLVVLELDHRPSGLRLLRKSSPGIPVIAVAVDATHLAFEAAKLGATAFLPLPLAQGDVAAVLDRLLDELPGGNGATPVIAPGSGLVVTPSLFSSSPRMREIRDTIEKVATTSATVLIRGESGVGKEIAARLIFSLSGRCDKPFIKVNCAAIPNDLLESELFGYEAGAFTGAQRSKPGKFELADGGTLFLDEIGEMHPALQAKLLHVLQDGEFARLGAKRDTAVDVRVLCATNKLLEQRVAEGLFREDLFYRINVVTVHIPPLRERRNEISGLIRHFIDKYSGVYDRPVPDFPREAMDALVNYAWPGNIRELENLCKRYVIVADATQIIRELALHAIPAAAADKPETIVDPIEFPIVPKEPSLLEIGRQAAWAAERHAIQEMLVATKWNRREAARRLRVSYKALLNKIKLIETEAAHAEHASGT